MGLICVKNPHSRVNFREKVCNVTTGKEYTRLFSVVLFGSSHPPPTPLPTRPGQANYTRNIEELRRERELRKPQS
jgi:hypothetical protein